MATELTRPQIKTLNVSPNGGLHALVRLRDDWEESCIHLLWHTGEDVYKSLEAMVAEFLATEQETIAEVEAESNGEPFSWMDLMDCIPDELMAKHNLIELMIPGHGLGVVIVPSDDPLEEWRF